MENKILFANFISFLPLALLIFIIINLTNQIYKKQNNEFTNKLLISFILSLLLSEIFKKILFKKFTGTERPTSARGCDFFSIGPDVSGKPGFPSGHMSVTSAACVMFILFLINSNKFNKLTKVFLIILNLLFIVIMGWARHVKKCHNILQIIGGIILGTTISSLLYFF